MKRMFAAMILVLFSNAIYVREGEGGAR